MSQDKNELILEIKTLSNLLDVLYDSELNFRNHCYLRIAYDNTVDNKWDLVVQKPFVKYATIYQLKNVINLFQQYLLDKNQLLVDNQKSLKYRMQVTDLKIVPITLF